MQTNGYIIQSGETCLVIDAPAGFDHALESQAIKPTHLLLTHQHFDHVEAVSALEKAGCTVIAHTTYSPDLIREDFAQMAGLDVSVPAFTVDQTIDRGSLIIGDLNIDIAHVPGHSPDSITFYFPDHSIVVAGDTLFAGGIGRTDLPGGNHDTLLRRIRDALLTLPAETRVFPGHGPATTINREKNTNPYLQ